MMLRSMITVDVVFESLPQKRPPTEYHLFLATVKGQGFTKKQIGEKWAEEKIRRIEGTPVLECNDEPEDPSDGPTLEFNEEPKKRELYGVAKIMSEMKGCKGIKMCDIAKQLKGAKGLCTKN